MPNIKGGANRFKTKKERLIIFNQLRDSLEYLLEKGLNPYTDPDWTLLEDDKPANNKTPVIVVPEPVAEAVTIIEPVINIPDEPVLSIKEAFEYALKIKKKSLNDVSYINYEGRINRFKKSLDENEPITSIIRKITNQYLNGILENSSPRNRNNSRIDLSSLFEVIIVR